MPRPHARAKAFPRETRGPPQLPIVPVSWRCGSGRRWMSCVSCPLDGATPSSASICRPHRAVCVETATASSAQTAILSADPRLVACETGARPGSRDPAHKGASSRSACVGAGPGLWGRLRAPGVRRSRRVSRVARCWPVYTREYMPATAVMTLRIDPALLSALRQRAKREGRSVSAEVVRMIRKEVEAPAARRSKASTTMGMFGDFEAPDLEEFKRLRRTVSAAAKTRVRRTRRSA
jgi:hypothetical protein